MPFSRLSPGFCALAILLLAGHAVAAQNSSFDLLRIRSAVVALVDHFNIRTAKLDPMGVPEFSYILTDTPAFGGGTTYDGRYVGIAYSAFAVDGVTPRLNHSN